MSLKKLRLSDATQEVVWQVDTKEGQPVARGEVRLIDRGHHQSLAHEKRGGKHVR